MNDEELMLDVSIAFDDAGLRYLMEMAKAARAIQDPLDRATAAAARLNKEMQAGHFGGGGHGGGSKIPMPSIPLPQGMPTGGQGGMGNLLGTIGKAGSMLQDLGGMAGFAEAALLEFTGPLAAAVVVVDLMAGAAKEAAGAITAFRSSMITSGGTEKETGLMRGLGSAAGVSDMAGLSRQLADRLAHDPSASAFGQNAGIHDFGGAFSNLDKSTNLIKAIDYMQSRPHTQAGNDDAARFARIEGLEDFLKMRSISDEMYQNFKKSAEANVFTSPDAIHNAAAYNVEVARVGQEWDHLKGTMQTAFLPGITSLVSISGNALHELNTGLDRLEKFWAHLMGDDRDQDKDKNKAEKEHTEALQNHAAALRNGTFGGGPRARGAMPSRWGGDHTENWDKLARGLGAM